MVKEGFPWTERSGEMG